MSAVRLTNIEQSPYCPDLKICGRFLFIRLQEHCRMQHYLSTEELKMDVFDTASEMLDFKRVREGKKALRRYGSIARSLYYTIVCFILVAQAYSCVLKSCENIYGTYQVLIAYFYNVC